MWTESAEAIDINNKATKSRSQSHEVTKSIFTQGNGSQQTGKVHLINPSPLLPFVFPSHIVVCFSSHVTVPNVGPLMPHYSSMHLIVKQTLPLYCSLPHLTHPSSIPLHPVQSTGTLSSLTHLTHQLCVCVLPHMPAPCAFGPSASTQPHPLCLEDTLQSSTSSASSSSIDSYTLQQALIAFLPTGGIINCLGDAQEKSCKKAHKSLAILGRLTFRVGGGSTLTASKSGKMQETAMQMFERLLKEIRLTSKAWRVCEQVSFS